MSTFWDLPVALKCKSGGQDLHLFFSPVDNPFADKLIVVVKPKHLLCKMIKTGRWFKINSVSLSAALITKPMQFVLLLILTI
jgi:hypothetical protein